MNRPRSLYVIGGAGAGKSTFMAELLRRLGAEIGPLEDLAQRPNARGTLITLRGHRFDRGVYLGVMRESFPGSDGLDRASSIAAEAWLESRGPLPDRILGEGNTLGTRRFLAALGRHTHPLVLHLEASEEERQRRFQERGSNQAPSFVSATATRSANLAAWCEEQGIPCWPVATEDPADWAFGMGVARRHLEG